MSFNMIDRVMTPEKMAKYNREIPAMAALLDIDPQEAMSGGDLNRRLIKKNDNENFADWVTGKGKWVGSPEYHEHWRDINLLRNRCKEEMKKQNTIVYPTDYFTLVQAIVLDITRRRQENADFTGMISEESTRLDAQNPMNVKSLLPYTGEFGEYQAGQAVNMIQQKTGGTDTFDFTLYAIGFERDLYSVLFDMQLFEMQKVMDCVARCHTGLRNNLCLGPMLNATFHASQVQPASSWGPADPNGILTYEHAIYDTLLRAWRRLVGLLDMQTNQEITAPRVILAVRTANAAWAVNAVVNGYLQSVGTNSLKYLKAIPVDEVWTYKGDSWRWFNKTVNYPGINLTEGYLFVPGTAGAPFWTVNKAPLTQRVGQGSVLTLGQEQRAWWFGQGNYYDLWLGSSGAKGGAGSAYESGYGYVVKIEWPSEDAET